MIEIKNIIDRIHCAECLEFMRDMPADSVDTIITDPPYGIRFMGKAWDGKDIEAMTAARRDLSSRDPNPKSGDLGGYCSSAANAGKYDRTPAANTAFYEWCFVWAKEALRVAKPGAIALVFGGTRTYHRLTCAMEDAGWQIRDCMMWLYGSGFPKSTNISLQFDKRACRKQLEKELGRKPTPQEFKDAWEDFRKVVGKDKYANRGAGINGGTFKMPNSTAEQRGNITAPATELARLWEGWGTALKPGWEPIVVAMKPIEGTFCENAERWGVAGLNIDSGRIELNGDYKCGANGRPSQTGLPDNYNPEKANQHSEIGRWPSNVILDDESAAMLDEQSGELSQCGGPKKTTHKEGMFGIGTPGWIYREQNRGASRFFYCAKASKAERNMGCEGLAKREAPQEYRLKDSNGTRAGHKNEPRQNHHPTVKPLVLMEYLCRLTKTPAGGVVLDCFGGSGTTAMACVKTDRQFIVIEKDEDYCQIARLRTQAVKLIS